MGEAQPIKGSESWKRGYYRCGYKLDPPHEPATITDYRLPLTISYVWVSAAPNGNGKPEVAMFPADALGKPMLTYIELFAAKETEDHAAVLAPLGYQIGKTAKPGRT